MTLLHIATPQVSRENGTTTLSARIRLGDTEHTMWFRLPSDIPVDATPDPFVIALYLTAMNCNASIRVESPVSARLLQALPVLDEIHRSWYPKLAPVHVQATEARGPPPARVENTAAFFSGGMDAFYTAIKNQTRISTLVLVHGFDFKLSNMTLRKTISASLQKAARQLSKKLIEVETNCREITEPHANWPFEQYGPALAAVAASISGAFNRVLIPATATYGYLVPNGSHPLTDPLWSTDTLTIEHDGAEATRNQKARFIAPYNVAMNHLRVCWRNPENTYNCGHCEKCIRSMINLLTAEALDRCTTFPTVLTPALIDSIAIPTDNVFFHVQENLTALQQSGRHADLSNALAIVVRRYYADKLGRELSGSPPLPETSTILTNAVFQHRASLLNMLASQNRIVFALDAMRALFRTQPPPGT